MNRPIPLAIQEQQTLRRLDRAIEALEKAQIVGLRPQDAPHCFEVETARGLESVTERTARELCGEAAVEEARVDAEGSRQAQEVGE